MDCTFSLDQKNLTMVRGDTLSFGMEFEGLNQDLTGAYFTCRKNLDGPITFQKSLGDGITKVEDGRYVVRVAPADTSSLEAGDYYYDLEIGVNSDVFTILRGVFGILQDVTY